MNRLMQAIKGICRRVHLSDRNAEFNTALMKVDTTRPLDEQFQELEPEDMINSSVISEHLPNGTLVGFYRGSDPMKFRSVMM